MSELVVAQHMTFSMVSYERPAPPRVRDEGLMGTALAVSFLIHLLFLCGGALAYWFTLPAPVIGPRVIDVTLVEISAFDTVLPPPQLPHQDPKARAVIPPPEEQRIERQQPKNPESVRKARDTVVMKRELQKLTSNTTNPAAGTNSPASIGGGDQVTQNAKVSYHHMVATLLAKAKRYPERAVRAHVTGSGSVRVTIAASGVVEKVEVATSTQSNVLDDELLRMVDRAAPFPSFPLEMDQSEVTLLVPVSFRLEH